MMNDAISRSTVHIVINSQIFDTEYPSELDELERQIDALPALDVAPVVHAHWIKTFGSDGFVSTLRCSKCGNAENSTYIPGNFCWFCGAKMDGDSE